MTFAPGHSGGSTRVPAAACRGRWGLDRRAFFADSSQRTVLVLASCVLCGGGVGDRPGRSSRWQARCCRVPATRFLPPPSGRWPSFWDLLWPWSSTCRSPGNPCPNHGNPARIKPAHEGAPPSPKMARYQDPSKNQRDERGKANLWQRGQPKFLQERIVFARGHPDGSLDFDQLFILKRKNEEFRQN